MTDRITCPNCGYQNTRYRIHCKNCRTVLSGAESAGASPAAAIEPSGVQEQEDRFKGEQYFLSYSRQQLYFAESLANHLNERGVRVWFDIQRLLPGINWKDEIDRALDQSSGVILVASQSALASPYVRLEWMAALDAGRPVYVLIFEAVELPPELAGTQPVIDFRGNFNRAAKRLLDALHGKRVRSDHVPKPNRLNIPSKVPPQIGMISLSLIYSALIAPYIAVRLAVTPVNRIVFGGIGLLAMMGLLIVWWRFIHRRFSRALSQVLILPLILSFGFPIIYALSSDNQINVGFAWPESAVVKQLMIVLGVAGGFSIVTIISSLSADFMRWSPTNTEDPQKTRVLNYRHRSNLLKGSQTAKSVSYTISCVRSDGPIAAAIEKEMGQAGHRLEKDPAQKPDHRIAVISQNTPDSWLKGLVETSDENLIVVLADSIEADSGPWMAQILKHQIIDYRDRAEEKLKSLAEYLRYPDSMVMPYSEEVLPVSLTESSIPPLVKSIAQVLVVFGGYGILTGMSGVWLTIQGNRQFMIADYLVILVGALLLRLSLQWTERKIRLFPFLLFFTAGMGVVGGIIVTQPIGIGLYLRNFLPIFGFFAWCFVPVYILNSIILFRRLKPLRDWLPGTIEKQAPGKRPFYSQWKTMALKAGAFTVIAFIWNWYFSLNAASFIAP